MTLIIDTSGSLPAQTLADFWAELREVATEIRPESVHVLQVDATVKDAAEYPRPVLPPTPVMARSPLAGTMSPGPGRASRARRRTR